MNDFVKTQIPTYVCYDLTLHRRFMYELSIVYMTAMLVALRK